MFVPQTRRFICAILLFFCVIPLLFAQAKEVEMPRPVAGAQVAATGVTGQSEAGVRINPRDFLADAPRWEVRLSQRQGRSVSHGNNATSRANTIQAIEQKRLTAESETTASIPNNVDDVADAEQVDIVIQDDFIGNDVNGWTPPDNSIAVADNGKLVSLTNSSIRFMDADGSVNLQTDFSDYLGFLELEGGYFDPRVIYDPSTDKFIMVVINGNSPVNDLAIGFSTTDDPMDTWWFYTFSGAPDGSDNWFDFPNIGVSTNDFYLTGNLFNSNDNFQQSLIYQIDKANAHTGGSINFTYFSNVSDANGNNDFNIVPISYGYNGTLGPGIFFASTNSSGGTTAEVYYTTAAQPDDPQLEVYSVDVIEYFDVVDGLMSGTTQTIRSNDTRLLSGYWANETIHFVLNTASSDSDFTRIYYGQINTTDQTTDGERFGLVDFEYTFPAIAPLGTDESSGESVIGFSRTGSSIFPQYRVVGVDDLFDWTGSQLVKNGEDFVDFNSSDNERWGDYSGISRQHSATPQVYIAGSYANSSQVLGTWIARIGDSGVAQAPNAEFVASATTITEGQTVTFSDVSSNSPTSLSWTFEGGSPSSSTSENPVISYNTPGLYTVSLVAGNAVGSDTETKVNHIQVNAEGSAPAANFTANVTSILEGENVAFTDLSQNEPTAWSWTFQGGQPATSTVQNPTVNYPNAGIYQVSLVAQNAFGSDTETRSGYIEVEENGSAPVTDFFADLTEIQAGEVVNFTDVSTNEPTNWGWSFEGGDPAFSALENPSVLYANPGIYGVTLVAGNDFGDDVEVKEDYVTVGVSSVIESDYLTGFSIAPNPVIAGNALRASFGLEKKTDLDFFLVDASGRLVRHLLRHNIKAGANELSFSTQYLISGAYFLVVQEVGNRQNLHSAPFIVK